MLVYFQLFVRGTRLSEILFFHDPSKSLIATDLVTFVTDKSALAEGASPSFLSRALYWLTRSKNRASLALMWQMGFADKLEAKRQLTAVVNEWKPERVILGHGELIEGGNQIVTSHLNTAWGSVLTAT